MPTVHFVRGKVEETLLDPRNVPSRIALLRLDTDWYASTRAELSILWPRLAVGGLLIVDDYDNWGGARRATEEFLKDEHIPGPSQPQYSAQKRQPNRCLFLVGSAKR